MKIIGTITSPFKEKFSLPRQSGLIEIPMQLKLQAPYNREEAILGLKEFSHLWLIFLFHAIDESEEKLSVRPPRLGGNKKQGVFATRSPFRPNRLGLSVVKLQKIENNILYILASDLLDQTPILDIKPYLKEVDAINSSTSSWTDNITDQKLEVIFENNLDLKISNDEMIFIKEILALDPRPRYHETNQKNYATKLFEYDLHWKVTGNQLIIFEIKNL